jgi:hypothetical protein
VAVTCRVTPSTLADYGVTPRKAPTPLTAEQKATAALKRKATRALTATLCAVALRLGRSGRRSQTSQQGRLDHHLHGAYKQS